MPAFEYRLAFHKERPGASRISFPSMAPIPVFVMGTPYLTENDFVAARIEQEHNLLQLTLTPGAREKINEVGKTNAKAKSMDDYVGLLLYVDGQPEKACTMVYEPIDGFVMELRGMEPNRVALVEQAVTSARAL